MKDNNQAITLNTVADLESLIISTLNGQASMQHQGASNKQKANALKQWVTDTLNKKNGLVTLLNMMKATIEALPQGKVSYTIGIDQNGQNITKVIEYRDGAKKKFVPAFNGCLKEKGNEALAKKFEGKTIKFKGSLPSVVDKDAPKSIESKLETLLKDVVDSEGISKLTEAYKVEQVRTLKSAEKRKIEGAKKAIEKDIIDKGRVLAGMGISIESQVVSIGDMYSNMKAEEIKQLLEA